MKISQLIHATTIVLFACILGCATPVVNGRYSYESSTDFSELKSFAIVDVSEGIFSTPESSAHFRTTMTRELSAKGFTENPKNPDFWIVVPPVETYVEEYVYAGNIRLPMGLLRVSFVPASGGGSNLYEAVANSYFESGWSQEDKNLIMEEAVKVILAKFPPVK
jgi:hypothetical protein